MTKKTESAPARGRSHADIAAEFDASCARLAFVRSAERSRSHPHLVAEFAKFEERIERAGVTPSRMPMFDAYERAGNLAYDLAKDCVTPLEIAHIFRLHADGLVAASKKAAASPRQ
ncbi:MAG: hypothetical protein EOR43_23075 [Mesorhizobium sp.]|uniref:hypothetical protein n=1 Tax=Mesorhizobium sp. TaxID=1871066 RepID=UPI000FE397C4|nr:hypothetical protein [Mesorhizobium sp.]RWK19809.1 MAG: hypothetical protein EOR43_23075 [Mesorhizobium sp.]RWK28814.1 MAG: hypothetical protein EOR44_21975 [Mesorhizobium sp.]